MNKRDMIVNRTRELSAMFPAFFRNDKHNFAKDFGLPTEITDKDLKNAYEIHSLARSAVSKTARKAWEIRPELLETPADDKQTAAEVEAERAIKRLRLWQTCIEAEKYSLVCGWSGLILRLRDGKKWDEPVTLASGGWAKLLEVIPVWKGQLTVSEWITNESDENYGKPKMFLFQEAKSESLPGRSVSVHPDRVIVWSSTGDTGAESLLRAGYYDLLNAFKVTGAAAEGFWKNAKSAPYFNMGDEASVEDLAIMLGVEPSEVADAFSRQVEAVNKGFDASMLTKGIDSKVHQVSMTSPEQYFMISAQCFAAAFEIPVKVLLGSQTGERASTEDASEWALTGQTRRDLWTEPMLDALVERLKRFGILPKTEWTLYWPKLTDASPNDKLGRAKEMAEINVKMQPSNELVFTHDEIREEVGRQPLTEDAKWRDEDELPPIDGGGEPLNLEEDDVFNE